MTQSLPLLTDEQVQRSVAANEETSFGSLATERGHLPLEAMDVQARIDGLLALVDLRQTFVNTLGEPLEATYIFPLPDRAAVRRFRMEVAGRVIDGVLQERAQARKEYEEAIRKGHRAAPAAPTMAQQRSRLGISLPGLFQMKKRVPAPPPPPPSQVDLSAHRRRAQELLDDLQRYTGKDGATQLRAFGSFALKLELLIHDLKSVSGGGSELPALEDLLRKLKELLSADRPNAAAIATVWAHAETVLRAFAKTSAGRRGAFWK